MQTSLDTIWNPLFPVKLQLIKSDSFDLSRKLNEEADVNNSKM